MPTEDRTRLPDYKYASTKRDWTNVTKPITPEEVMTKSHISGSITERVGFYNDNADVYEDDMMAHGFTGPRRAAETVHKYIQGQAGARILDIGCGTGLLAAELQKLGVYRGVEGLDPAENMLAHGFKQGRFTKIHKQYFHVDSGLPNDCYDVVTSCGALIPGHLRADSVKEMVKLTKPG